MIASNREKALLIATGVFFLYALLGLTLRKHIVAFNDLRRDRQSKQEIYKQYLSLIGQHNIWSDTYKEKASLMPVFGQDRQVETYWLSVLDRLATKNGLTIVRRQTGEEKQEGDVYELAIDCKEWEGSLESLVGFLYDVHSEGAMLVVRRLFVRPATGRSGAGLRGNFTLYCAYMRGEEASEPGEQR